jgi:SAM-dependent methyltransferase
MKFPDVRTILQSPFIYTIAQRLVRGRGEALFVEEYVKPHSGDRVLDVGCGPANILFHLPDVEYVGFDIDPRAIEWAKKRHSARGTFFCAPVNERTVAELETFDVVLAVGVVHHLPDDDALALFRLAKNVLKPQGRLVTWDCCFVEGQSAFSRFLMSRDRGQYVRRSDEYVALAAQVFPSVKATIDHDLVRIPYPSIVMQFSQP